MKLKNLFTCTVTGLLLCTSCIKDEAPNAEADILNCILPAEMLTGTDIDYNRPYGAGRDGSSESVFRTDITARCSISKISLIQKHTASLSA